MKNIEHVSKLNFHRATFVSDGWEIAMFNWILREVDEIDFTFWTSSFQSIRMRFYTKLLPESFHKSFKLLKVEDENLINFYITPTEIIR